jgi:hypothetical protein
MVAHAARWRLTVDTGTHGHASHAAHARATKWRTIATFMLARTRRRPYSLTAKQQWQLIQGSKGLSRSLTACHVHGVTYARRTREDTP